MLRGICLKILNPELPVSSRMLLIVWQFEVPGAQTVTLTVGLLGYVGSLTMMGSTFKGELVEEVLL
jgi:hypothetical protein